MRVTFAVLLLITSPFAACAGDLPFGQFTQTQCVGCHQRETPEAVTDWQKGPHGNRAEPVDCIACHGSRHAKSMARARKSAACVVCHGGDKSIVARSYFTSKHGVIAALEGKSWDWSLPLADANYRAPTCAYCHMHDGSHGLPAKDDATITSCADCHAPRYADRIVESGKRSLKIGELKVQEAEAAIASALGNKGISIAEAQQLQMMADEMRKRALTSLRLGLGHHSPDYQWWYGQAALDGDLIKIKAFITRLRRTKDAAETTDKSSKTNRETP